MRLGTCLLPESLTLQGAHPKLAYFCSALVAGYYAAVDTTAIGTGRWRAPIVWSGLIVSASWAFGPLERYFLVLVADSPRRCAA